MPAEKPDNLTDNEQDDLIERAASHIEEWAEDLYSAEPLFTASDVADYVESQNF